MLNKAILIGRVGQEPNVRASSNGKEFANFSLATSERWHDKKTGEKVESTEWHNVVVFNEGLVKLIKEHLKKGMQVYIEGQIKTRKWQDKNEIDRYSTEIVLQGFNCNIILLSSKIQDQDANDNASSQAKKEHDLPRSNGSRSSAADTNEINLSFDDDIPF